MNLAEILDGWALAVTQTPEVVTGARPSDADIAIATTVSRTAFGEHRTKDAAKALVPLLEAAQHSNPQAITGRQLHVLIAIAAADLLARDQIAAFLTSYEEPGVAIAYQPVSVTGLRRALHEVIGPFEDPSKRLRLITGLAAHTQDELLRWAPEDTPFRSEFVNDRAQHPAWEVRSAAAAHRLLDPANLAELARDEYRGVRQTVAWNPSTHADALVALADDKDITIVGDVAKHPNCPPALIAHLVALAGRNPDPNHHIFISLASNPSTPPELLARLARSRVDWVRNRVASNPNTPALVLVRLYKHRFSRDSLAKNPSTPPTILARLATKRDVWVRENVARNPNLPAAHFARLAVDRSHGVRLGVASNPATPPEILEQLANDQSPGVRKGVARNPNTPSDALARLALDTPTVAEMVARNPSTSAEILAELANHELSSVRDAVAQNPSTSPAARALVAQHGDPEVSEVPTQLPTDPEVLYREALEASPSEQQPIPAPSLLRLAIASAALRAGVRVESGMIRSASDLPSLNDLVFPTAHGAQAHLAHSPVPVTVIPNGRALAQNGRVMKNCTLSDHYALACQRGTTVVAAFTHHGARYNVAWEHDGKEWTERDLAGVDNELAPKAVKRLARAMRAQLEGLEPVRPLTTASDATFAEMTITLRAAERAQGEANATLR